MIRKAYFRRLLGMMAPALFGSLLVSGSVLCAQPVQEDNAEIWIIDGHNDLPLVLREKTGGDLGKIDLGVRGDGDTDIPKLRAGNVGAQFWSVYVPSGLSGLEAVRYQLEQIDIARRMIAGYDDFALALSVADIEKARAQGRIASLLGMEGAHPIANSMAVLRAYYDLGVRYATLTHSAGHDWADSATSPPRHGGLTRFGTEVVREMNRLGMLVDLSHVSADAMNDALDVAEAPVIFSHSSAFALTPHPRNVPDDVLRRVAANGGIVMVTFIPPYVNDARRVHDKPLEEKIATITSEAEFRTVLEAHRTEYGEPPMSTIADVADHVEHVAKVAGKAHVGIGSDFFGAGPPDVTEGLEDVSRYPALIAELRRRSWSEPDLAALAHGNFLRVMREAEQAAARLQASRPPSLATIAIDDAASE
ncbi:dipeptidase [Sphingopyxis sp. C-1]|uniref:dipeptidase n=1 Tax=Sphingopyxis sp. C-1 TaxID=262667 RepID=UPI0006C52913|nr:dipeptidase [Sphingopyxis sp. C-1]GAO80944.1 putative dipeptidase [Sphingopyxis sp. C-1]